MSDILINLAAEFTGKKAFSQTDKAIKTLGKSAKYLASSLGIAFGTKAIVNYVKMASKAAAQDQKAQSILANNLKNLGLAYANVDSEKFIGNLERQSGILDDELRPAYAQLARTTGSIAITQKLMTVAFDASNGAGLSYAATIDILSKAYVGNKKQLKQLDLGLSNAELTAMSFDEILTIITKKFAGSGEAALDGYAGKMAKFDVATANAAETLGGAFLDAFSRLAGNGDIDVGLSKMQTFSEAIALLIGSLTGGESLSVLMERFFNGPAKAGKVAGGMGNRPMSVLSQDLQKSALAAQKKAELEAIKRNKELAKLAKNQAAAALAAAKAKKDQAALDKAALALAKGVDVFDMDKIQINAALLAKQAEINKLGSAGTDIQRLQLANDLVRLTIKQDMLLLEDAIAAKDVKGATALAAKLNKDLAILGVLQGQNIKLLEINSVLEAFKPKDLINLANLNEALALLIAMAGIKISPSVPGAATAVGGALLGSSGTSAIPFGDFIKPVDPAVAALASINSILEYADAATARANAIADAVDYQNQQDIAAFNAGNLAKYSGTQLGMQGGTVVNISAGVIASPDEFARMVQKAVQNANRFGNNLDYAGGIG